jgi:hypothetical protein
LAYQTEALEIRRWLTLIQAEGDPTSGSELEQMLIWAQTHAETLDQFAKFDVAKAKFKGGLLFPVEDELCDPPKRNW